MKVSIITPCYNREGSVEDTLRSVLKQDHPDIEYIVIDGASTDRTKEIIERYRSKISHFVSEKDKGMYDAINKGIRLATGEVIGILNSDDLYADEKVISKIVRCFEENRCDAVYGDLQYVSQNTKKVIRHWKAGAYKSGLFLKGWMPPHPTFFVKKKKYDDLGLYDTRFTISADYELMLRFLHKHKVSIAYLPEVLVKMRAGGMSNASLMSRLTANREDRMAWKINGLKPGNFTLIAKPLSKLRQFFKM